MNPAAFFLQLLPLLVFIVADAFFNNAKLSITVAVITAAIQLTVVYMKTRQIDWFIVLDAGLIIALGAISILLNNDLFFKMKPALIDFIAVVLFIVFVFAPDTFLIGYFGRIMQGQSQTFRPEMVPLIKKMLVWMSVYTAIHGAAVIYTALHSSRKVWAFVAGPGFYLLFIPVIIAIIFKRLLMRRRPDNRTFSAANYPRKQ